MVDIPIHSQTTIADVFQFLTEKINLNESFGFGLFLSTGQNIRSLVVGGERLMDALALIEEQNNFDWKLYLRKELFLPLEK
uniref:FERM domain-containing protein n=1 Tax=Meloidogyne javanica TaxID=6303 RepID=A0A915MZ48_MELJA